MLLIYPPVAKPSEPPAGLARLSGALSQHNIKHSVIDMNAECMRAQFFKSIDDSATDRWTARARKHLDRNIAELKGRNIYNSVPRYQRAVADINRAFEKSVAHKEVIVSLANYKHSQLSPVRSSDLLQAANQPETNPFYSYFSARLEQLIERRQPSIVGFSLTYLSQALCTFAMLGFLRQKYPKLQLVCGGGLITSWLSSPDWKDPFAGLVDHFIDGPGEEALLKLTGKDSCIGHAYRPDYNVLPLSEYLSPGLILPYSASSGCFWNRCTFCPENAEANSYQPIRSDAAAAELASLTAELKPSLIHILDNAVSPSLLNALIKNPPGAAWYGFARIGRELTDPAFCMALRQSGCIMLKLGVESGDQTVLDSLNKGVDLGVASAALRALKQAGIGTYVYLLFGTPAETAASAARTLDFTLQHAAEIGFLNLAIFNMPVNSREAGALGSGSFYEGDLSLYTDFEHPAGWSRREVRQFIEKDFKKRPAISAILKSDPPYFSSNHAAFFTEGWRISID